MIKTSETIESIAHAVIDKVAKVAVSIAKAVVTLVCLGASVSYRAGIKAREIFDTHNAARSDANSDISTEQEVNVPVDIDTEVEQQQQISNTLTDTIITTEKIVDVIQSISLAKPIVKVNSIENFITTGLRDTLANNYLEMVSYKLPRNRRTKKTHVRHNDVGVMKEHYEILTAKGILR